MNKPTTLERNIRSVLARYRRGEILATQACRLIDETMASATGRGNELPHDALEWESDGELVDTVAERDAMWV